MLFGVKLANEIYPPWKQYYVAYDSLKKLLKESSISKNDWTEGDETRFAEALDADLEKVYSFQTSEYKKIEIHIKELEIKTEDVDEISKLDLKEFEKDIEETVSRAQELDRFSRLNFTAFLKIVKKHDRLHPNYSVKALFQVRLHSLPFYSEDYSPLLYRLSSLFSFLRENFKASTGGSASAILSVVNEETAFSSYKFWIHPDNLMEVKTRILRHLPVLLYNSSKDNTEDPTDPTVTNLYFDNPSFELYNNKLGKNDKYSTLRLRWSGKLSEKPEITLEKQIVESSQSSEIIDKLIIKDKYIQPFLEGSYSMEKNIQKMIDRHSPESEIDNYKNSIENLQEFIQDHELSPVVRVVYTRTAFQIPGDNRVRVTIDSDVMFIREDSFDFDKPIRDPSHWHRTDIDSDIPNPYSLLRKGEFSKFPHAIMEIKVRNSKGETSRTITPTISKKHYRWISELTNSHLAKAVPNFSKFIQGITMYAEDDRLDNLPFWLPELEHDIRRDPNQAWEEEKNKLKEQQKEVAAINNRTSSVSALSPQRKEILGVSNGKPSISELPETVVEDDEFPTYKGKNKATESNAESTSGTSEPPDLEDLESSDDEYSEPRTSRPRKRGGLLSQQLTFPFFKSSKLSVDSEDEEIYLPPGVVKPTTLIRQSGPVKVEAKVWLANERTFNRWLSVTSLLSVLTFSVYNSVSQAKSERLATIIAYVYFALTLFTGFWGYHIYIKRLNLIRQRSGKHLDGPFGPIVLAVVILVSLTINFVARFKEVSTTEPQTPDGESQAPHVILSQFIARHVR